MRPAELLADLLTMPSVSSTNGTESCTCGTPDPRNTTLLSRDSRSTSPTPRRAPLRPERTCTLPRCVFTSPREYTRNPYTTTLDLFTLTTEPLEPCVKLLTPERLPRPDTPPVSEDTTLPELPCTDPRLLPSEPTRRSTLT